MKRVCMMAAALSSIWVGGLAETKGSSDSTGLYIIIGVIVVVFIGMLVSIGEKRSPEEEQRIRAEEEANRARMREEREKRLAAMKPVKTKILMVEGAGGMTKTSVSSSVGRAVVGGILGGAPGAIVGAATGKKTTKEYSKTTFKVWYADGHTKIETVMNGGYDWNRYMELLEDEE